MNRLLILMLSFILLFISHTNSLPVTRYTKGGEDCDYGAYVIGDWCYSSEPDSISPRSYETVKEECRFSGGNITSIHSDVENELIKTEFPNMWIGLEYQPDSKTFIWADGTTFDYNNLSNTFVQYADYLGYCAVVNEQGVWVNNDCNTEKYHPICKKKRFVNPSSSCPNKNKIYDVPVDIYSPGFPAVYHFYHSDNCSYLVVAKNGFRIKLGIFMMDWYNRGKIDVYEGVDASGTLLGTFTFVVRTEITTNYSNAMYVVFSTTADDPNFGIWMMKFTQV